MVEEMYQHEFQEPKHASSEEEEQQHTTLSGSEINATETDPSYNMPPGPEYRYYMMDGGGGDVVRVGSEGGDVSLTLGLRHHSPRMSQLSITDFDAY